MTRAPLHAFQQTADNLAASSAVTREPLTEAEPVTRPAGMSPLQPVGERPHDLADRLPSAAREKLIAWRQERDDLRLLINEAREQRGFVVTEKIATESQLRKMEMEWRAGRFQPYEEMMRGELWHRQGTEKLNRLVEQFNRAEKRRIDLDAKLKPLGERIRDCEAYLKTATTVTEFEGDPLPSRQKIDAAALGKARQNIETLKARLGSIRKAPATSGMAKAIVRRQIEELAAAGTPDCLVPVLHKMPLQFKRERAQAPDGAGVATYVRDSLSLMAWVFKDQVIAALEAEIDRRSDDKNALTDEDRAAAIEETAEALLDAERLDVALTEAVGVPYRGDHNPRALLGIM
jgi:hypothetical protein